METYSYYKIEHVSDLFLEKDAYALGILSILLRSLFLFFCLVLLPVFVLLSHIEFDAGDFDWVIKIILVIFIGAVFTGFFILFVMLQAYFYRQYNSRLLGEVCQLHLTAHDSLFSFQYALLFDFSAKKLVLVNHYKKAYLIKTFSDVAKWYIQQNNKNKQKFSLFGKNVFFDFQIYDHEKMYEFSFKLSNKQAQRWGEVLAENLPPA